MKNLKKKRMETKMVMLEVQVEGKQRKMKVKEMMNTIQRMEMEMTDKQNRTKK